ncbi:MAG TPA: hypothetical protein VF707_18030 [Ardenticatenaceae bacterium]|jgi:phage FluMu gp28-like protein
MKTTRRWKFLYLGLDLPAITGMESAAWETFQFEHLNDDSRFRIECKSRQIAWSWTVAAEAIADACDAFSPRGTLFTSINLEEAKEKIRYARHIFMHLKVVLNLPKLIRESETTLEWNNGARLISLPATPPRGKAGMNLVLDEFAHVRDDRAIYQAALPVLSRGGRIRIGSSPLGANGLFWELFERPMGGFTGFTRKRTPWWEVHALSTNTREAQAAAPTLPTRQRVERWGREPLRAIYANMPEEDFQCEYEAIFGDERSAWISWDEIRANQTPELLWLHARGSGRRVDGPLDAIRRLALLVRTRQVENVLAAGVDVGRTRDATELFVVGLSTVGSFPLRLAITLDKMAFDEQALVLSEALRELPIARMLVDQTGIGRNLAETMRRRFPAKVAGVDFTLGTKQLWATDAKMLLQQQRAPLPVERDIAYQIHSIKRLVTASRNLIFDAERSVHGHSDKFWAWALALSAAQSRRAPMRQSNYLYGNDD